jgi:beta-barrel assembly-enhancing protease
MKKHALLMALALGLFSTASSGEFDFGKVLESMGQEPQKKKKSEPASSQASGQSSTQQPGSAQQPAINLFGKTSVEDEVRIGKQVSGDLLGAAPLVKDDTLQQYVNTVGRWVSMQSNRQDLPWKFGVIESEDINAFAAPGGFVFLTKGLYKRLNSEAELAGVLAHEVAHVAKKHHLEVLKKSALIGALAQSLSKEVKGDQGVQNLIGNGAEMMARGLDKEAEFEADRVGAVFAARAGYDPWGLPSVLQDMSALSAKDNRLALLYKTHPTAADRLARLGEAVGDRFDSLPPGKEFGDRFYRIR